MISRAPLNGDAEDYKGLSRLAGYIVALTWVMLALYILSATNGELFAAGFVSYFLSTEESGIKFRALTLLAPFVLTVISYLINEKAKLSERTFLAERRLHSLLDELIIAFANALDAKSPWTMGHSERVATHAVSIAQAMHLGSADLETLKIASLLHDIGKLGTYDVILDKAGPLTEDEWRLVMMHPKKGADILGPIADFDQVIPIVRSHHERVDGKGYPDGLKGEEIPLLAKILCLADSFDAMTAERPYKSAMNMEDAISHIRQKAGTQFDPEVVKVFLALIDGSEGHRPISSYVPGTIAA